ncbi:shiftless antiviral inhibitor of ribosomal frameshifting protein homolog isoform X2 [Mustelus asterias]
MHQDIREDEIEVPFLVRLSSLSAVGQCQTRVLQQREKNIRRLRETFHAKVITVPKADSLIRRYNNDCELATQEILQRKDQADDAEDDAEAQQLGEENDDNEIQEIVDNLRMLPLTEDNVRMFDLARSNEIPSIQRQFACSLCDRYWWRKVPERKQVSRCRCCKHKYDAVPRDQEWGFAEYICEICNNSFRHFGQMGLAASCYRCRSAVLPIHIIPPQQDRMHPENRRRIPHGCCAEDCYNRQEPYVPGTHCVHPRTRQVRGLPKVLCPSLAHESTGSTVASCISQDSSMECDVEDIIQEDLRAIPEEEEDE